MEASLYQYRAGIPWLGDSFASFTPKHKIILCLVNNKKNEQVNFNYRSRYVISVRTMEELIELRKSVLAGDYSQALKIIDELEEMSVEDKLNKIYSYTVILLLHLIKQTAEQKTTRSWQNSILNSVEQIKRVNKRRKSGGYYAQNQVLREIIDDAFPRALRDAALEAFGGAYESQDLQKMIVTDDIKQQAFDLLKVE